MYTESLVKLGKVRSEIREIFEYGNKRKAEIGAENVFDFSIGNPSVPAPKSVDDAIIDLVNNFDSVALHGYTSAQGDAHAVSYTHLRSTAVGNTYGCHGNPYS